jgi:hypothetical protein
VALWRFHDHALAVDIIDRLAVHQRANHPEFQIVVFRFGRTKIRCGNRASSLNMLLYQMRFLDRTADFAVARMPQLRSVNGRWSAFASSHGARIHTEHSSSVVRIYWAAF